MTPLPHQDRVAGSLSKSKENSGLLLYHKLGTGKTYSSINAAGKMGKNIVAVVPASLRENYKKEIEAAGFKGKSSVISYEEAQKRKEDPELHTEMEDAVLVIDEAHRMGRTESQRSSLGTRSKASRKLLLTGSPIRNHPHELVPLINSLKPDALPKDKKTFDDRYIEEKEIKPGLMGKLRGAQSGITQSAKNTDELKGKLKGLVDYQGQDKEHFPGVTEEHVEVEMGERQSAAYKTMLSQNPTFAYKVKHGIPPGKDIAKYKAFLTGLRQISNTPAGFAEKATDEDASKIMRMADEVKDRHSTDKNYRGYSYSNFLGSGLVPLKRALDNHGISNAIYSGALNDQDKKDLIERYNKGKIKHLLISSAGSEGLDLKGTKHIQLMDPHWHQGRLDQVKGRGIRYKSHAHLPKDEQTAHVQYYRSVNKSPGRLRSALGGKRDGSSDEMLHTMSTAKQRLNESFLDILKSSGSARKNQIKKTAMFNPDQFISYLEKKAAAAQPAPAAHPMHQHQQHQREGAKHVSDCLKSNQSQLDQLRQNREERIEKKEAKKAGRKPAKSAKKSTKSTKSEQTKKAAERLPTSGAAIRQDVRHNYHKGRPTSKFVRSSGGSAGLIGTAVGMPRTGKLIGKLQAYREAKAEQPKTK